MRTRQDLPTVLSPLELLARGDIRRTRARAIVANLPRHIAERELRVVQRRLAWNASQLEVEVIDDGRGPGNIVILEIESEQVTEVCTAFGEGNVAAEAVAGQAAGEVSAPKRKIAMQEFALGIEALERFARREPLRRDPRVVDAWTVCGHADWDRGTYLRPGSTCWRGTSIVNQIPSQVAEQQRVQARKRVGVALVDRRTQEFAQ